MPLDKHRVKGIIVNANHLHLLHTEHRHAETGETEETEEMSEIILDTLIDGLKMLPFLFAAYWVLAYLEHKSGKKLQKLLAGSGKYGAVGGALLGAFPQCGFSVAAANLYAGGIITTGTLVAVFISTSDEAVPILLANPGSLGIMVKLIVLKVILGMAIGLLLDYCGFFSGKRTAPVPGHPEHSCSCSCGNGILKEAIHHTLQIFCFLLVFMLALNFLMAFLGEARLARLFMTDNIFQPAVAALVGFIPNCAASVLLTELFLAGTISFGSVVAGLSSSAGLGLIILLKTNHNAKENLKIMLLIYVAAVAAGMLLHIFG